MSEIKTDPARPESEYAGRNERNLSSEEYVEEIEHTRDEINETLHSLEDRLSPKEMWNRTVDEWGEGFKDFSGNFGTTIRKNPIPAVMMGISMLWLMSGDGSAGTSYTGGISKTAARIRSKYGTAKQSAIEKRQEISGSVKNSSSTMKEMITATTEEAKGKLSGMTENLKQSGEQLRHKSREWKQSAAESGEYLSTHPLLLAAAGIAFGSLAALAIPITRKEKQYLGPSGSDMIDRAEEYSRETVEKGKKTAAAATEAARESMAGSSKADEPAPAHETVTASVHKSKGGENA